MNFWDEAADALAESMRANFDTVALHFLRTADVQTLDHVFGTSVRPYNGKTLESAKAVLAKRYEQSTAEPSIHSWTEVTS